MNSWLVTLAAVAAAAAAVRSTWSPCGLSMLSSLTPLAERGRGHRYGATAAWFVAGGALGGAALGAVAAGLAAAVGAAHLPGLARGVAAAAAAALGAASDLRLRGFSLPTHGRQVNERWLDHYRPWVYGLGFGAQIGCGLATAVMTAAVYLTVVLAALAASPVAALVVGVGFGTLRGLAVLAGARLGTPAALLTFHRRFEQAGPSVARAVAGTQAALAAAALGWLWPPAVLLVLPAAALAVLGARRRRTAPAPAAP